MKGFFAFNRQVRRGLLAFVIFSLIIGSSLISAPFINDWIAHAVATIWWDGGGNGTSWSDPNNWNTNVLPVAGDDVLIETSSTVVISDLITVNSLVLGKSDGSAATILQFSYDAVSIGPLTISNGEFKINNGASVTHASASGSTVMGKINILVQNGNANIYGSINVDSRGYPSGNGPGAGVSSTGGTGGGGYGGRGGSGSYTAGGVAYGDPKAPDQLGSGGGHYYTAGTGGGAVKLTVNGTTTITGTITANGSDGGGGSGWCSGGGSGGSIWINTTDLVGSGTLRANGGSACGWDRPGGGGGGGRIALFYTSNISTFQLNTNGNWGTQYGGAGTIFKKAVAASNGDYIINNNINAGAWNTSIGAVAETPLNYIGGVLDVDNITVTKYARIELTDTLNVVNTLTLSVNAHLNVIGTLTTNTLNVSSSGWIYNNMASSTTYSTLNWTGGVITDGGGTFSIVSGGGALLVPATSTLYGNVARIFTAIVINGTLSTYSNASIETYKINYTSTGDLTVNSGAYINVDSRGYSSGAGPGAGISSTGGTGGGGYGGNGGGGSYTAGGNAYGNPKAPNDLGSSGGQYYQGGSGGGAVKLIVSGLTTINGTITANGGGGSSGGGWCSGGGSGGSIWINTTNLTGTGTIRANGGSACDWDRDGGGGAGGRIAFFYTSDTSVFSSLSASGNWGSQYGGAGTIFKKAEASANGDFILNNGINAGAWNTDISTVAATPLSNGLTADNLTITKYARVDLTNTLTVVNTLSLSVNAHLKLTGTITTDTFNISSNGWFYNELGSTITHSSLDWTGGIITDMGGAMFMLSSGGPLTVPATSTLYANVTRSFSSIVINGTITNYSNSSIDTYKINYTSTGDFTLNSGAFINVDSRGYSSSYGPGAGVSGAGGTGGGGYGGNGGNGSYTVGGPAYGDPKAPYEIGSAGGHYYNAGSGGGAVKITVNGLAKINGTITANGGGGSSGGGWCSGGGSGGAIWIITTNLTGTGTIRANGGNGCDWDRDGGGGSGGRIALFYTNDSSVFSSLSASGNWGAQFGSAGTIFKKASAAANGDFILNNNISGGGWNNDRSTVASTPLASGLTVDNLTITKYSRVDVSTSLNIVNTLSLSVNAHLYNTGTLTFNQFNILTNGWFYNNLGGTTTYSNLNWTGGKITDDGGTMNLLSSGGAFTLPATSTLYAHTARTFSDILIFGTLTHYGNGSLDQYKINLTSTGNIAVNTGSVINLDSLGYSSGNGPGAGVSGWGGTGGGGYGGIGGNGTNQVGGPVYGDLRAPDWLGSGGGHYVTAGSGGGAVKLTAIGTATINGTITSNGGGGNGSGGHCSGGGSGGSIWIISNILEGTGTVRANGGNGCDWDRDGGGGGGGRIAFYYAINNSAFTILTVARGSGGPAAQYGSVGTIFLGGKTSDPINLRQYKLDGITGIGEGSATNENGAIFTFQVQDGNASDVLTPQVEFIPVGSTFNNIATDTGTPVVYNGIIVTASVSVSGLADNSQYHWQARACDAFMLCSNWVSFGNNTEDMPDLRVLMNANPNSPTIPDSSFFINSQYTNNLTPTLGFVLSDPNALDSVRYRIQMSTEPSFIPVFLDYTSELEAQGTRGYMVGQPQTDNYAVGFEGQQLSTGMYFWRVKTIDDKSGESDWTVAPGNPSFKIDLERPTNATNVSMKAYAGGIHEYVESSDVIWFNRNDLFFKWDAGGDTEGVKGYCLYLGTIDNADPGITKGLLGTSPVSTTGSTCQFITDNVEIDFSNSAFRSFEWLTSSSDKYYFRVKTIDIANNTYEGPDVSNFISFNFDNTPPQNVTAISSPSSNFSSRSDMYFTWPTAPAQSGSDSHSGLLGFQYALNTKINWYGDFVDSNTGLSYSVLNREQPLYFPLIVQNLVQLGQNTIYFRTVDIAGNVSELRTAFINYGGEAPKFPEGEDIIVTPQDNTINRFAFSWPTATASEGNSLRTYYYMINTQPPASYSTITSNSATYIPTTDTFVSEGNVPGLRKGANTINVVAVDWTGNYSPTNTIFKTFYLNSTFPDPPSNLIVADGSIKDASLWRAALVWDLPVYQGTGELTFHIERSEDGIAWTPLDTTLGTAYIDTVPESKQYFWRVATTDTSDESIASPSYSSAVSVIPRGRYTTPARLTSGPAASSITTTTAMISWTTNRTCDSKISFGLASGNYYESEPSISTHVTEHKITMNNLIPGTDYYFVSKWTDEDGNTGVSEEKKFTTEPPPEVKGVRISNLGISSAIVNFTTKNASRVRVYYGTSTSFGGIKEINTSKVETTYSIELDKLEDGVKYYFQINTFDEMDAEYDGTILDFTTLPRPRVSNILIQQVINTAQSTLLVSWDSNTKVSSIVTYYPETDATLARDNVELILKEGQHKMLIKGLFPDTVYVIRVSGKDIIGNEAVSDTMKILTSSDSRSALISSVKVEGSNNTEINGVGQNTYSQLIVSWTTDEPTTSQVEYGEGSGIDYNQLTQEDNQLSYSHVVIISGLTPSKVYHLRVISKDKGNNISKSVDTLTITPKASDNAFDLVITTLKELFGFLSIL